MTKKFACESKDIGSVTNPLAAEVDGHASSVVPDEGPFSFNLATMQKRFARQNEIMAGLVAGGMPVLNAAVISGDMQSAELASERVAAGESPEDVVNFIGSYARFDWAVANLPRAALLEMLPELWRSADPDDTKPEYLELWREAYRANGNKTVCDGKRLPLRHGIGAGIEREHTLTIYRGQVGDTVGISWTLDKKIAEKFAATGGGRMPIAGGKILQRKVRRDLVLAYLTGRDENEVIIDPNS